MLAIDDIQWSDRPSLRFVSYLAPPARRRPGTGRGDAAIRPTRARTPRCWPRSAPTRSPNPSGRDRSAKASVAELVRSRLGADAHATFVAACEQATGGNPLLLRQLLTALAADGVQPTASSAAAVREIGPRAVSRTVLLRLSRLPAEASGGGPRGRGAGGELRPACRGGAHRPGRGRGRARRQHARAGRHPAAGTAARVRPPAGPRRGLRRPAVRRARAPAQPRRPGPARGARRRGGGRGAPAARAAAGRPRDDRRAARGRPRVDAPRRPGERRRLSGPGTPGAAAA